MNKKFNIKITNQFKKSYTKIMKQENFKKLEFEKVIGYLLSNIVLPEKYKNHLLKPKSKRNMGMPYSIKYFIRI